MIDEFPSASIRLTLGTGYQSTSAHKLFQRLNEVAHNDGELAPAPGGSRYAIHFRTLGNVAYFMLSLNTGAATIRAVEDRIWHVISKVGST